jgi:hypothetical protein
MLSSSHCFVPLPASWCLASVHYIQDVGGYAQPNVETSLSGSQASSITAPRKFRCLPRSGARQANQRKGQVFHVPSVVNLLITTTTYSGSIVLATPTISERCHSASDTLKEKLQCCSRKGNESDGVATSRLMPSTQSGHWWIPFRLSF